MMKLSLLFLYIFEFLYLFSTPAQSLEPKDLEQLENAINIVVPPDGLGGFGDLTSNLYMAEKLVKQGLKINVFIPDSFKDKFKILSILEDTDFDNFFWGNKESINYFSIPKNGTKVSGIDFCQALPESSISTSYVSFSSLDLSANYQANESIHPLKCFVKNKLKNATVFSEYIGIVEYLEKDIKKPQPFLASSDSKGVYLPTGPLSLGMYISEEKPLITKQKDDLIEEFFNLTNLNSKLSFSYTASPDVAKIYLEALNKFALENKDISFFLISKHKPTISLSENLHVATIPNLSFQKTRDIIAASDFPLLVTGDMSLTLAMDYEKEFFYEALNHKFNIEENLRLFEQLKNLPNLSIPAQRVQVQIIGISPSHEVEPDKIENLKNMVFTSLKWFSNNPGYMSNGINSIRANLSLPLKFSNIMSIIKEENLNQLWSQMPIFKLDDFWNKSISLWLISKKYEENFDLNIKSSRGKILEELYRNNINFELIWTDSGHNKDKENFDALWKNYKTDPNSWEAQEDIIPAIYELLHNLGNSIKLKLEPESDIAQKNRPII